MDERRRHPRVPGRVRVWVVSGSRTIFSRVHDVSAGGLGLHVPSGFAPGDEVTLTINGDGHERVAVVAWADPLAFGLRFLR